MTDSDSMNTTNPSRVAARAVRMADDGKHGGNPAPIKPWTPPPTPPNPDGNGRILGG